MRKLISWTFVVLALLGLFLPWTYSQSAFSFAWKFLFSSVSRPVPDWLIWFCAPLAAAGLTARALLRQEAVSRVVLVPCIFFVLAWVGLILSGYRMYTGLGHIGFLLTLIGMLGLGVMAVVDKGK